MLGQQLPKTPTKTPTPHTQLPKHVCFQTKGNTRLFQEVVSQQCCIAPGCHPGGTIDPGAHTITWNTTFLLARTVRVRKPRHRPLGYVGEKDFPQHSYTTMQNCINVNDPHINRVRVNPRCCGCDVGAKALRARLTQLLHHTYREYSQNIPTSSVCILLNSSTTQVLLRPRPEDTKCSPYSHESWACPSRPKTRRRRPPPAATP